ncbi:hypothetical protein IHE45_17G009400 [Dioscorea alata]|uniref:Uncharacterized protein n=1 Tax=Dioscorea alata TaxID=55571 RepID=A0ACB7UAH5_DIOAL|nr:hypothetical protein IHE45_17G009400 [Dioscorea alata]
MDDGMTPVRLLLDKTRTLSLGRVPPCTTGIEPLNWLPNNALKLRFRYRSWCRRPNSGGTSPENLLRESSMLFRKLRLAMEGDMKPPRPNMERLIEIPFPIPTRHQVHLTKKYWIF